MNIFNNLKVGTKLSLLALCLGAGFLAISHDSSYRDLGLYLLSVFVPVSMEVFVSAKNNPND